MTRVLHQLEEWLIAFLLAAMTLVTFVQVVARYVFNYSFSWAFELTTFLFAALIFLGISWGVRINAHIGVDALVKLFPRKLARVVAVVSCLLCLFYTTLVFYGAWYYVSRIYRIGVLADDVPIPLWVPITVLPIGYALLFLRFGVLLVQILRGRRILLVGDEAEDAMQYASEDLSVLDAEQP